MCSYDDSALRNTERLVGSADVEAEMCGGGARPMAGRRPLSALPFCMAFANTRGNRAIQLRSHGYDISLCVD